MPLLPIFLKLMGSAAMRGAGSIGMAKVAGTGFAQNYTRDFGEGVKRGLKQRLNGRFDGQNFVAYAQGGLKKLFYELPKAIGQRRWGEHMAGALVKVTSERLATMNAALSPYGGGAHTYAQSMTSLADKAFKLGFGEADWIKSIMKYTRGEYDPFGTGPNGMKTKEENREWFKDRYNGRKDLVDEARTIGGILDLTPDIIKLIIDGHRELLEKGNHLTAEQVRVSSELELARKKTESKWQEVADIWGANTAGFWKGWEEFKGGIADWFRKAMQHPQSTQAVVENYDKHLRKIYGEAGDGKRKLEKTEAENIEGLRYHMTQGDGKEWTDEQMAAFALAQSQSGVGKAEENFARLKAVRENTNRAYIIGGRVENISEDERTRSYEAYKNSNAYKKYRDSKRAAWISEMFRRQGQEEYENELLNPSWFNGSVTTFDSVSNVGIPIKKKKLNRQAFLKTLDKAPERVRKFYADKSDDEIIERYENILGGQNYDPNLKEEHLKELYAPWVEGEDVGKQYKRNRDTRLKLNRNGFPLMPPNVVPSTGILTNGVSCIGGDRTFTNSPTVVVKSVDDGIKFVQDSIRYGQDWLDYGAPEQRGQNIEQTIYNTAIA